MTEKEIQDEFSELAWQLTIDIRNELSMSESIQVIYAKLVWAYYEGLNEESGKHHEVTIRR